MSELLIALRSMTRGLNVYLKTMPRPVERGVSNEGAAYHLMCGLVVALSAAADDLEKLQP